MQRQTSVGLVTPAQRDQAVHRAMIREASQIHHRRGVADGMGDQHIASERNRSSFWNIEEESPQHKPWAVDPTDCSAFTDSKKPLREGEE